MSEQLFVSLVRWRGGAVGQARGRATPRRSAGDKGLSDRTLRSVSLAWRAQPALPPPRAHPCSCFCTRITACPCMIELRLAHISYQDYTQVPRCRALSLAWRAPATRCVAGSLGRVRSRPPQRPGYPR